MLLNRWSDFVLLRNVLELRGETAEARIRKALSNAIAQLLDGCPDRRGIEFAVARFNHAALPLSS